MNSSINHTKGAQELKLALVTPARNEAAFIGETIRSVVAQNVRPIRWVIVSDGSTDGTDEIVQAYVDHHDWIELVSLPERKERDFAGKVRAFNAGYARLANVNHDIIGNLDADIALDEGSIELLLQKFAENPLLGVAGVPFTEEGRRYDYRMTSVEHVSGACQLFRRECFTAIGGYRPIRSGGIDLVAVTTARMKGWQTRTFTDKTCTHHRKMSSAKHSSLGIAFDGGWTDYTHGCAPLWQVFRSVYQMTQQPFVVRGALCFAGYCCAFLRRAERVVPEELIRFRKAEQMRRLGAFLKNILPFMGTKVGVN